MRSDGFLTNFCVCGLIGGTCTAARQMLRGDPVGFSIGVGVLGALVLGLIGAVSMAITHDSMDYLIKALELEGGPPELDVRERITLPLPVDRARAFCVAVLQAHDRFTAVREEPASGIVRARSRISRLTWGERIECRVQGVEGGSQVSIRSRPLLRTTIQDFGRNRENVERIRTLLAEHASTPMLATNPPPEAEAPFRAHERAETGRGL
jgi:hypothetical protein